MGHSWAKAVSYFQVGPDSLWRWGEEGEVVAWADGSTVVFRDELSQILFTLAPGGLPPFGPLILLLAACRGKVAEVEVLRLPQDLDFGRGPVCNVRAGARKLMLRPVLSEEKEKALASAAEGLRRVTALPAELRTGLEAKAVLADLVFEEARECPDDGRVRLLSEGQMTADSLNLSAWRMRGRGVVEELVLLAPGLEKVTAERLRMRARTGLDELPGAPELPLQLPASVRRLLGQLRDDDEYRGLARLTREVMAALDLPRSLAEPDALPVGGISGVINRGALDRLLLSELAHDDLTLSVRVALNEALYLRRDPPAQPRATTLVILVDVGIRMWGLPRLFGTAVALALAARWPEPGQVLAWRARRHGVEPIDLTTREGLTEHLAVVDCHTHPGGGLLELVRRLEEHRSPREVFVVTHDRSLTDPEFKRQLPQEASGSVFLAAVDGEGGFRLFAPGKRRPIAQARLDLESLFASTRPPLLRAGLAEGRGLPLALSLNPFPFLLPVHDEVEMSAKLGSEGGVALTRGGQLWAWDGPRLGARCLVEKLPGGRVRWLQGSAENRACLLSADEESGRAWWVQVDGASLGCSKLELPLNGRLISVFAEGDVLFLLSAGSVEVFDLNSGRQCASLELPCEMQKAQGAFFELADSRWYRLVWDGGRASYWPVPQDSLRPDERVLVAFARPGSEGPCLFTDQGRLLADTYPTRLDLGRPIEWARASHDGDRLVWRGRGDRLCTELILSRKRRLTLPEERVPAALGILVEAPACDLHRTLAVIGLGPEEGLVLQTAAGKWFLLSQTTPRGILACCPMGYPGAVPFWRDFAAEPRWSEKPYSLEVASWSDGSRAWADSRGLLHLRSSDQSIPELSVVLAEGPLTAWSAQGEICGPRFFTGSQGRVSPERLQEHLRNFVLRLR